MTLRVRVSIVPFGDEDKEYEIHQINISNLGSNGPGWCLYGAEFDKYKTGRYDIRVSHKRDDGPLELIRKVL